jgi:mitochondrial fission protein ELM1
MGTREGDNAQVVALGEALAWPYLVKRFAYHPWERLVNWPFSTTLAGVVQERSSPLAPPWPDLVISAGRRNEPVARWIRAQAPGRVRLVHVGRPWARLEGWDLVVTTPQYRLPERPNVLQNELPLHGVTPERLAEEAERLRPRLNGLPPPYLAVLAGGPSGPYPFDAASGARLAHEASLLASKLGASLLVTTSARTPRPASEALIAGVSGPAFAYRWRRDDRDNPYFAFLALADHLAVSADSVSMMAEACATGKPVFLFDPGEGLFSMREMGIPRSRPWWRMLDRTHLHAVAYRAGMRWGPPRYMRDIRIVQRRLVESGRAAWLGDGWPSLRRPPRIDRSHVERAVDRVQALF